MQKRPFFVAVLVVAVGVMAWWGGTAVATHDDPDVVHLCVKSNGQVSGVVVDPAECIRGSVVDLAAASAIIALEAQLADLETAFGAEVADHAHQVARWVLSCVAITTVPLEAVARVSRFRS